MLKPNKTKEGKFEDFKRKSQKKNIIKNQVKGDMNDYKSQAMEV